MSVSSTCQIELRLGRGTQNSWPEPRVTASTTSGTQQSAQASNGRTSRRRQTTSWAATDSTATKLMYTASTATITYGTRRRDTKHSHDALTSATIGAYPRADWAQKISGRLTAASSPAHSAARRSNSRSPSRATSAAVAVAARTDGSRTTNRLRPNSPMRTCRST